MCYPRDAMVASHRDPADRLMVRPIVEKLFLRKSFWNH